MVDGCETPSSRRRPTGDGGQDAERQRAKNSPQPQTTSTKFADFIMSAWVHQWTVDDFVMDGDVVVNYYI